VVRKGKVIYLDMRLCIAQYSTRLGKIDRLGCAHKAEVGEGLWHRILWTDYISRLISDLFYIYIPEFHVSTFTKGKKGPFTPLHSHSSPGWRRRNLKGERKRGREEERKEERGRRHIC